MMGYNKTGGRKGLKMLMHCLPISDPVAQLNSGQVPPTQWFILQ